jgi:dolichol-phosphate mannosyltransferase
MKLSIILPTYNEKDNIIKLIQSIIKTVSRLPYSYEIIVIDDNSPDATGEITKKHFLNNKQIIVYIRTRDKGFASAICYGINKSTGDFIIVMDTDFSHDPIVIPKMLSKIKSCDIVIGSRYAQNGGGEDKIRYWMSKTYNIFLRTLLRINISDFLFGYFCIKKEFIVANKLANKKIFYGFGDYFIRLAYNIDKSGGIFLEVPAFYKSRIHGVSKSNITEMIFTYTKTAFSLLIQDITNRHLHRT